MTPSVAPLVALVLGAGGLLAAVLVAGGEARELGRSITGLVDVRPALLRIRTGSGASGAAVGVRRHR